MECREEFIRESIFFDVNGLKGDDLRYLVSLFDVKTFPKDEIIFCEGTPRENFLVVIKGEIEISKRKPASKRSLIVLKDGDFLGEGLFFEDSPHSTNAEA